MRKFLSGLVLGVVAAAAASAFAVPFIDPGTGVADTGGYSGWGADIKVSVTSTSTTSGMGALTAGVYTLTCEEDTHADLGITGVTATTSERLIPAKTPYPVRIKANGDTHMALIRNATDGDCILSRDTY